MRSIVRPAAALRVRPSRIKTTGGAYSSTSPPDVGQSHSFSPPSGKNHARRRRPQAHAPPYGATTTTTPVVRLVPASCLRRHCSTRIPCGAAAILSQKPSARLRSWHDPPANNTTLRRFLATTGENLDPIPDIHDSSSTKTPPSSSTTDDEESRWTDWSLLMELLLRFHQEHGHCFVPRKYHVDQSETTAMSSKNAVESASPPPPSHNQYPLGAWVHHMRNDARRKPSEQQQPLTQDQLAQLQSLNFEWNLLEAQWKTQFHLLCQYQKQHGDCLVPRRYVTANGNYILGGWVDKQRKDRRKMLDGGSESTSPMTPDRMRWLDSIGFDWNPLETHWNTQYECLRRYQRQHGHCRVPQRYSFQGNRLGKWVQEARQQYRKYREAGGSSNSSSTRMTPERIQLLEQIGFDWNPLETYWCAMYDKLVQYRDTHGHWPLIRTKPKVVALTRWINTQRDAYRKYQLGQPAKITAERIARLDAIGFPWKAKGRTTTASLDSAKQKSDKPLEANDESKEAA